ncbi:hypothetical protein PPACK8108_LOCUS2466 [Phakopsora pachyrhizi]|uniref:Tet-like 2OG-Fe(II) oxygenase domain-containing protein n=1 Tax=Phakopsora pachyrhizi TaxID=170000 RepID=A0AAV0AK83_PHAPC|nr:hypothetical protein PPACK8108_LOCUS2466 [Phakopsora pachyrhizi]
MIVEFFPFGYIVEDRKKGWQDFVDFLLHRQNFINDVPNSIVRRYINQTKLNQQVKKNEFNQDEEAAGFMKMGFFLSRVFQEIVSGAYESCKSYLEEHSLPSLSQMNFIQKDNYCPEDFSSAITYTINDFSNKAHVDNDNFDVEGGEFVIRDLQVFIELPKVEVIRLVVLKTSQLKHQTLPSKSTSDLFTRFGISCQISKNMTNTMEKFHNHHYEGMNHTL